MVAVSGYRFVRYNGTDWCDALVPIHPLQWYQLVRNVGTDSSATVVPIRRYYQRQQKKTIAWWQNPLKVMGQIILLCF